MLRKLWMSGGALALMGAACFGQSSNPGSLPQDSVPRPGQGQARPVAGQQVQQGVPGQQGQPAVPNPRQGGVRLPNVAGAEKVDVLPGPINSPQDIVSTARLLFVLADIDGDGQISEKEAIDAGNLLVGGFFFRADTNGDGTLSKEEAQAARDSLFAQQPVLRFILERADRTNTPAGAAVAAESEVKPAEVAQQIGQLLDANNDRQIQAAELRQAVEIGVKGLFAAVDANSDGLLSPAELNAGVLTIAREGMQTAFQAADTDNSGGLSKEEFAQALIQPGYTLFDILDRDLDGHLTQAELNQAMQIAWQQVMKMGVTPPANSPATFVSDGRAPR